MELKKTGKYRTKAGAAKLFYGCTRYPFCTGTHGAHPDGRPLGTPADKATKEARTAAHKVLEHAFGDQNNRQARTQAYRWLKAQKDLPDHIGEMTKEEAQRVIHILTEKSTEGTLATLGAKR